MIETSARLLRLLSLLQLRREWTGALLAERMQVTERTVRRDIDKLRSLGYPINSSPGVAGGYQLGAGAELPPLLLDDDEALATALGLSAMTVSSIGGVDEASIRALSKLETMLPSRLRHRFSTLKTAVSQISSPTTPLDPVILTRFSAAIAAHRMVRFPYRKHDGSDSPRRVEPYRLVHSGRRWYLFGFDTERSDWRTFRVDRVLSEPSDRERFTPRPLPAEDIARYVHEAITNAPYRYQIVVRIAASAEVVREHFTIGTAIIEPAGPDAALLRFGWDSLDAPLMHLAETGWDFSIVEPAELQQKAAELSARLDRASQTPPLTET